MRALLQSRGPRSVVPRGASAASPGSLLEMYLPGPAPDLQDRKLCQWNHGAVFYKHSGEFRGTERMNHRAEQSRKEKSSLLTKNIHLGC